MSAWWWSVPALALLGLLVGSFLNVVAWRLPRMLERDWWLQAAAQLGDEEGHQRTFGQAHAPPLAQAAQDLQARLQALPALGLAMPASHCPACGHRLRWHELIPVLSWLGLRGRCAACGARIAWRYPMVELLTAALFAAFAWRLGPQPVALLWCGFAATLLAASLVDWDTTLLPDGLTLPLLWAGLAAAAAGLTLPLANAVAGAAAGYLALWSVYWLFRLVTGRGAAHPPWTLAHWAERAASGREGMGHGDFKLLAALGAWLGWQALLPVLLAASMLGSVVGLLMKAMGSLREGRYVPFGPFLAGAGVAVALIGVPQSLRWLGW